jgi:phosphate/phosphite/phosphonate ABC transporter binding protein
MAIDRPLRLLTYLAPGIPLGLYESIGDFLAARLDCDVTVASDASRSGPGPGSSNPFAADRADVGFLCAPSYVWMAAQTPASVELCGVAPVHDDPRNQGRPEYYAELVVHDASKVRHFDDLAGERFAFNDDSSLSGYHCVLDKLAGLGRTPDFFAELRASGSHQQSLELLAERAVDVAAIDANVLAFMRAHGMDRDIRVLETLGPFPVQPVVVRAGLAASVKRAIGDVLLEMHHASGGEPLRRFGVRCFAAVDDGHYHAVRMRMRARGATTA